MLRFDGRKPDEIRPVKITRKFTDLPEGSVLIEVGKTRVICTATVEDKVPPFKKGTGRLGYSGILYASEGDGRAQSA